MQIGYFAVSAKAAEATWHWEALTKLHGSTNAVQSNHDHTTGVSSQDPPASK